MLFSNITKEVNLCFTLKQKRQEEEEETISNSVSEVTVFKISLLSKGNIV